MKERNGIEDVNKSGWVWVMFTRLPVRSKKIYFVSCLVIRIVFVEKYKSFFNIGGYRPICRYFYMFFKF